MSSTICGNCQNFKPMKDERFFNCTLAKQAGVSYGMQVRADTMACDAFVPYKPPPSTTSTSKPPPVQRTSTTKMRKQPEGRQRPTGLCPWGRVILIAAIVIVVLIFAGLAYMCGSNLLSSPEPTPTPTPTIPIGPPVGPTPPPSPTPTPIPIYEYQYYGIGLDDWAISPTKMVLISSASRLSSLTTGIASRDYPPAGTVFILINVTYLNRGSTAVTVAARDFVLTDSEGYNYAAEVWNSPYTFSKSFGATVPPGKSHNGNILWVVPIPAKGLDVVYLLDAYAYPQQVAKWRLDW